MTDRLDTLLSQLRDTETDHRLDALEPAVRQRRQEVRRADDRAALRLVAVLFALLVGTGVGGMSIAFARLGKQVLAVDIDPQRLDMAKHNAHIYGVSSSIQFIKRDLRDVLHEAPGRTSLYLDPHWGGPD